MKIAWLGTGIMGEPMARHLLKAGHKLSVYNRTEKKTESLRQEGALAFSSIKQTVEGCDVVCTMLGYPTDVEEVILGEKGILGSVEKGTVLIDFTTSSPSLAVKIARESEKKGVISLDIPVSGGDVGAREGTLSLMAGGEKEGYEKVLPLLEELGANIVYHGEAGSGQHCKMCNQIAVASGMLGLVESLTYAKRLNLDSERVLQSISSGAASSWALTKLAPRILQKDFSPGFFVKHFVKDLKIAIEEARSAELDLPALTLAERLYEMCEKEEMGDLGTQALYLLYEKSLQA